MPEGHIAAEARNALRTLADALSHTQMADRLQEIVDGAFPTRDDCVQADRLLRHHPSYTAARRLQERQERAMAELVAWVCQRAGGCVLLAEADRDAPGDVPAAAQLREDAYVRALRAMALRVARLAGEQEVVWHVLSRGVEVGRLGRVSMQGHFVQEILSGAAKIAGCGARMRATSGVLRYREDEAQERRVHPGLVIADWLANQLRLPVCWHGGGYADLESECQAWVPTGALRRAPSGQKIDPLPTFGAAQAEGAIEAAFAAGGVSGAIGGAGWRWDQAREWAVAAGRWA